MRSKSTAPTKSGVISLAELVGRALDPVTARRGFATAELIGAWADIVGGRYADCSRPERIVWPRGAANKDSPGTLVVVVAGPRALYLQHEADQIVERVNGFLGHGAIGRLKIVQGGMPLTESARAAADIPLDATDKAKLDDTLADVESPGLRSALERLGQAVLADRNKKT